MLFSDFDTTAAPPKTVKAGIEHADARKKRQEASVQIRKNRREDSLRKRRQTGATVAAPKSPAGASSAKGADGPEIPAKLSALQDMLTAMTSGVAAQRLAGTKALRKLLSKPTNPPVEEVIQAGFLPLLCESLKCHDDTALQFEAAWALTNVGSSDLTASVVDAGALPLLAPLLRSGEPSVREQAAWCVGNIAGDCSELRDAVLATAGCAEGLLLNLQHPDNVSMMRNVTWAVSNLCRGSKPKPALSMVAPFVPVLARIIESCGDEETTVDACWALSYVSDGENERLDVIVDTGICPMLVKLLSGGADKCVPPCLRTLGNIVTGDDRHTQTAIDAGLLRALVTLFDSPKTSTRKEVAWTCSNVTAGTKEQIGAFLAMPGLPEAVVSSLEHGEWNVRKECAWTLANICSGGSTEHVRCIVERHNAIKPLCDVLGASDTKIVQLMLTALTAMLKIDSERYGTLVEEFGGLDQLENLQNHENNDVYEKARTIIETYFGVDDEDDMSSSHIAAPAVDDSGDLFTFPSSAEAPKPTAFGTADEGPQTEGFNFAPVNFA